MRSSLLPAFLLLFLSACSPRADPPVPAAIENPGDILTGDSGTGTPDDTPTLRETAGASGLTPSADPSSLWARNYVGIAESAGVTVEVIRLLVGDRATVDGLFRAHGDSWDQVAEQAWDPTAWAIADSAAEIMVRFTNGSSEPVDLNFRCGGGSIQIGSTQLDLHDVGVDVAASRSFCGDILWAGASTISGAWIPLNNMAPDEVREVWLRLPPPRAVDEEQDLGPWLIAEMDLQDHRWEELPGELR